MIARPSGPPPPEFWLMIAIPDIDDALVQVAIGDKEHPDLEGVDLVRFTFEPDEAVEEIHALVSTVFGSTPSPS
jgi:hypothetical protein